MTAGADVGIRVLRADDLVGRQHDRVRARRGRLVERGRVEHEVVALALDLGTESIVLPALSAVSFTGSGPADVMTSAICRPCLVAKDHSL